MTIFELIAAISAHTQYGMVGLLVGDFQGPILRRIPCAYTKPCVQCLAEGGTSYPFMTIENLIPHASLSKRDFTVTFLS